MPLIAAGANAPGLPFLRRLNWVESPIVTEDKALHRVLAALKGETVATTTPLWKLVNPYRGLEAMTEANTDYFYSRNTETATVLSALAEKRGRCPILVGASGVGKSSVARAGVLSALKSMQWPGTERMAASTWPAGLTNSRGWLSLRAPRRIAAGGAGRRLHPALAVRCAGCESARVQAARDRSHSPARLSTACVLRCP